MKLTTGNLIVDAIGQINFTGNIIPDAWYRNIRYQIRKPRGKPKKGENVTFSITSQPYLEAIIILSEIIYWYKPSLVKDEDTGEVIESRKKFKADKLQRSYSSFANQFGLSKEQVTKAIHFLKEQGLINTEFRTIITKQGTKLTNVLFLEPIPEAIHKTTFGTPPNQMIDTSPSNDRKPLDQMSDTNTEINTKIIYPFPSPLPSSHKKKQKRDKHHNSEGRKDKGKADKELFEKLRSGIYREDLFSIYDNLINIKTTEELTEDLAYKAIKSMLINNETFLRDKFNVTYNKFPFQETTVSIRKKFPYKKLPNGSDPDSRRNFFVAAICNTVAETLVDILEKKEPI
jgi:hypothetical protein